MEGMTACREIGAGPSSVGEGRAQGPLGHHSIPSTNQARPGPQAGLLAGNVGQEDGPRRHNPRDTGGTVEEGVLPGSPFPFLSPW